MRDTDYAFCVARIRARETKLLSPDFIHRLIEAESYDSAVGMLTDIGWIEAAGAENENFIRRQSSGLWAFLKECVPDKSVLDYLCVLNDYFNIKTAIKCILSGNNADKYYSEPSSLELEKLCGSIDSRTFDVFKNKNMREVAKMAFEAACMTNSGQDTEVIVDVAALGFLLETSKKSRYATFSKICSFTVDTSNIRTAIRCAEIGKDAGFISSALSECCKISKDKLVSEASAGGEQLREYLSGSEYAFGVELYYKNPALYDKWCDDKTLEIATKSGFTAFGFDPVCAYFYRKNNEIKTVKLILSAKKSGIPADVLRERVKGSYA